MFERSDIEEVDGLPVLAPQPGSQAIVPRPVAPALQTAAVAAGGFVAGAVVVRVLGRRRRQAVSARANRRLGRKRAVSELVEIVGSRSLLVDVHLLGASARSR